MRYASRHCRARRMEGSRLGTSLVGIAYSEGEGLLVPSLGSLGQICDRQEMSTTGRNVIGKSKHTEQDTQAGTQVADLVQQRSDQ